MDTSRIFVGISLLTLVLSLVHLKYYDALQYLLSFGILYDGYSLYRKKVDVRIIGVILSFMIWFIYAARRTIENNLYDIVEIATIAQLSDALQYFFGKYFGKTKIGWVSKNKSYEGYLGGYVLSVILTLWAYPLLDITIVYILGILGGLISSFIKRSLNVKDYSNLLGSHGGLMDRMDSVVLPIMLLVL